MIEVVKAKDADSRTANPEASKEDLRIATESHISDVAKGLRFIADLLEARGDLHDHTKLSMFDDFHEALKSGKIKESEWYHKHITEERHHLKSHVPDDVNLIDVIEHLVDCTMAGLTRSGTIYDTDISPDVLAFAAQNTVELLKTNTYVSDFGSDDILNQNI